MGFGFLLAVVSLKEIKKVKKLKLYHHNFQKQKQVKIEKKFSRRFLKKY